VRRGKNGQEALDLVREKRPTLVISDIEMPIMDGYQLCGAIKSDASLHDLPVVLLSTLSDPEDIIRGLRAGADNYLTKPYEVPFLLGRIQSLLEAPSKLTSHDPPDPQKGLEVTLAGKRHVITSDGQQILNLLMSTFENAVQKNGELIRANQDLTRAKQELQKKNSDLESANNRMKNDLDAAARAQQALLPTTPPNVPNVEVVWKYRPCDELAGDILNVFQLDDKHLGLYVLDVSGHGVPASLLSVTLNRVLLPGPGQSVLVRSEDGATRLATPVEVAEASNATLAFRRVVLCLL